MARLPTRKLIHQKQPYDVPPAPEDRLPCEGETIFQRAQKADYKVDHDTGCWVWQKYLLRGYPQSGPIKPHRLYYIRANGKIPAGHDIHHRCHNTACLNPEHLEAVPHGQHISEHKIAALRTIGDTERAEIRELARDPDITLGSIAECYGISTGYVDDIIHGRRYVKPEETVVVLPDRFCRECGGKIEGRRRNARYCSVKCRATWNGKKPAAKARQAERQRQWRARKAA